uniref:Uncharacterized protein n=1 Tax=Ciona savignyi TaxID=51511 RepID=H2YRZ8_CIOSA
MEDFSQNMVVLKRDKKDLLLTNKDPHLSHLFEHTGPRTPNSVSTSMNQSAMEVDGSFTETASEDYQLFEEQGGSYMPEFSPDAPNLIIDTGGREGYNNNNCTQRDGNITTTKTKDYPQQCKTETNAGHPFSMSESTESGFIPDSKFSSNQTKRIINHSSPEKVPQSNTTYTSKQEKGSPPPDNYNMQLLAHHAQQHQ